MCALCKREIEIDKYFSRKSQCPKCGRDLHICLNCKFYSESSHNKCIEPTAEFQRARDKANFCDYFVFMEDVQRRKETGRISPSGSEKEDAKKRFEDLFKK